MTGSSNTMCRLLLCVGLAMLPSTKAWVPFFGEESHKHLNLEEHHREWDLLELLSINGSQTGVSAAKGPIPDTPAWRLRAVYDNIQLDPSMVHKITSTLHSEITFYFVYKQHKKSIGSLLSVNLPGKIKPWLQVDGIHIYL
ncbi:unnamed protein product [Meganyctiphanes norvegica]|uniref:Uncharacterized protein n=1 Tax=Meganyctiphanes norvegica TaxID=48144 RepID=A0AAV2Q8R5_MEGNR